MCSNTKHSCFFSLLTLARMKSVRKTTFNSAEKKKTNNSISGAFTIFFRLDITIKSLTRISFERKRNKPIDCSFAKCQYNDGTTKPKCYISHIKRSVPITHIFVSITLVDHTHSHSHSLTLC